MRAFEYASPETREDAVKLLSSKAGETAVLAGGTDLISLMKDEVVTPGRVVNIKSVEGLGGISYDSGSGLRIGALLPLDDLEANSRVRSDYPSLQQAVDGVRSAQIRSRGTVGGDLCQRPRCWYYRHGFGLLAKWQGKAMVPDGDNRYHAILGAGPAYFVNPSSLAPALIALGAKVNILGPKGGRTVDLASFYRAPSADGESENVLAADEIVTDIVVPAASDSKNATYEVREKEALDWPLAAAAVSLRMSGSTVKEAKVVLGHVAPTPWMSQSAGQALKGKSVSSDTAMQAGEAAVASATPLSRNKYKIQLARVAVKRAVLRAAGMEEV
jgi:xanthine dehydrogenase YagS FAD-binding subunit